eukprot:CAMPEP_0115856828 /NCGR_PEP_ID=MMETSP0287-20121206/15258_1 /TAXON_ID=412157 /ORGANISM="Chrysochromulina rotalis, Strain UIO044" /LENGTH=70 /DNA_ID=CAMNT_0003311023 /DNA_START=627 /DNA_END=839 /DNA_ORIENTATION=-
MAQVVRMNVRKVVSLSPVLMIRMSASVPPPSLHLFLAPLSIGIEAVQCGSAPVDSGGSSEVPSIETVRLA